MSKQTKSHPEGRRAFIRGCAVAAVAVPLAQHINVARAADRVDPNSEQAKALHYVTDAKQSKDPKRTADQFCHNCQFYQGKASDKEAGCAVFGGKLVPAQAWCSSWVKKAA